MSISTFPWNSVNTLVQDRIAKAIRDQIFLSNATWHYLAKNKQTETGGRRWVQPLSWKLIGGGGGWFAGPMKLPTQITDPLQAAEFTPKNSYVPLWVSWDDEMAVSGPEKIAELVQTFTELARNTAVELHGTNVWNSGTDMMAMTGLQYIFPDWASTTTTNLQTYGTIPRQITGASSTGLTGTNVWWSHMGDPTAYTTGPLGSFQQDSFASLGRSFAKVFRASGKTPNLLVSNVGIWTDYHNALVKNERMVRPQQSSELGKLGFESVMYRNAAWVKDEKAPSNFSTKVEKLYGFTTESLVLKHDPRAFMSWTGWRTPADQMARGGYFLTRGEIWCKEPRLNFVMSNVDTTLVA